MVFFTCIKSFTRSHQTFKICAMVRRQKTCVKQTVGRYVLAPPPRGPLNIDSIAGFYGIRRRILGMTPFTPWRSHFVIIVGFFFLSVGKIFSPFAVLAHAQSPDVGVSILNSNSGMLLCMFNGRMTIFIDKYLKFRNGIIVKVDWNTVLTVQHNDLILISHTCFWGLWIRNLRLS